MNERSGVMVVYGDSGATPTVYKGNKVQTRFLVVPKVSGKTSDSKTHRSRSEESSLRRVCARVARRVSGHMRTSIRAQSAHQGQLSGTQSHAEGFLFD